MKWVVLARDNRNDGCICDCFGVYSRKRYADARLNQVKDNNPDIEYCVEEVDPAGSFANDRCQDE